MHVVDSGGMYGAEMIILSLMEHQKKKGHEPLLLSLGDVMACEKDIERAAKAMNIEEYQLRFKNGLNIRGSFRILENAKSYGAQIIHSHGYKSNILLGIVPRSVRSIPIITTLHGWTSARLFSKMGLYQALDIIALKRLDKVITVTMAARCHKYLKRLHIRSNVIYNGIPRLSFDSDEFERCFPDISKTYRERFKILYIGRLSPEKGVDVLIRSVSLLKQKGISVFLAIIGDGQMKNDLSALVEKTGLGSDILMLGYQERAYRFMPFFDLFVLPSYTEGLPVTVLEAMQAKLPVVATSVGEVPALLGEGKFGKLVPPGDYVHLANTLDDAYTRMDEMKNNALECFEKTHNKYSIEGMSDAYMVEYQSLVC
jgi:glycosyltransferase involved in cell wall biosynthesis